MQKLYDYIIFYKILYLKNQRKYFQMFKKNSAHCKYSFHNENYISKNFRRNYKENYNKIFLWFRCVIKLLLYSSIIINNQSFRRKHTNYSMYF